MCATPLRFILALVFIKIVTEYSQYVFTPHGPTTVVTDSRRLSDRGGNSYKLRQEVGSRIALILYPTSASI